MITEINIISSADNDGQILKTHKLNQKDHIEIGLDSTGGIYVCVNGPEITYLATQERIDAIAVADNVMSIILM